MKSQRPWQQLGRPLSAWCQTVQLGEASRHRLGGPAQVSWSRLPDRHRYTAKTTAAVQSSCYRLNEAARVFQQNSKNSTRFDPHRLRRDRLGCVCAPPPPPPKDDARARAGGGGKEGWRWGRGEVRARHWASMGASRLLHPRRTGIDWELRALTKTGKGRSDSARPSSSRRSKCTTRLCRQLRGARGRRAEGSSSCKKLGIGFIDKGRPVKTENPRYKERRPQAPCEWGTARGTARVPPSQRGRRRPLPGQRRPPPGRYRPGTATYSPAAQPRASMPQRALAQPDRKTTPRMVTAAAMSGVGSCSILPSRSSSDALDRRSLRETSATGAIIHAT